MNVPLLVLDVDGVIIEGFPRKRWDATLRDDLGIRPKDLQKKFFKPHWQDILTGKVAVEDPLHAFLESTGTGIGTQEFLAYWHGRDAHLRADVLEAAADWKQRTGGKTAIATNQDLTRANYLRIDLGLDRHFDSTVVSCEIGALKPEANFFRLADDILGRQPGQEVVFIDDLADNVTAARTHGWDAMQAINPDAALEVIGALHR